MTDDRDPPPEPRALPDEAEPLPRVAARAGRAPRRLLLQASLDDEGAEALAVALEEWLAARGVAGEVVPLDARRELPWTDLRFLALDTETTGLDARTGRVIEVAWVLFDRGRERARFSALCHPGASVPAEVTRITAIDDDMLRDARPFADVAPALLEALADVDFVTAYHAAFDQAFLEQELRRCGLALPELPWVDPLVFVREVDRFKPGKKLEEVSRRWGVTHGRPHRALDDAVATGALLLRVSPFLPARTLHDLLDQQHRLLARQRLDERAFARRPPPPRPEPEDDQPPS